MDIEIGFQTVGLVVDNVDPLKRGRCKVKALGVFDDLPTEEIPWAFPIIPNMFAGGESKGFGYLSVPKMGTPVRVEFNNGSIYAPEYAGLFVPNTKMLEEISETYLDSHVLAFDEDIDFKVFTTPSKGLIVYYKGSNLTINPDSSIKLEHKDTTSIMEFVNDVITIVSNNRIELSAPTKIEHNSAHVHVNGNLTELGTRPDFSVPMGETLMTLLDAMALIIDAKWSPTPGLCSQMVKAARAQILSKVVKTTLM